MKIAVAAVQPKLEARVSPRFGKTPWLVVFDTACDETDWTDHRANHDATEGSGARAVAELSSRRAEVVVCRSYCEHAAAKLVRAGIRPVSYDGSVQEAIDAVVNGDTKPPMIQNSDGEDHHHSHGSKRRGVNNAGK